MTKPDRKQRPSYVLTGGNIVEHIFAQQELKSQTRSYFHFSPLWRAIRNHISDNGLGESYGYNSTENTSQRRHDINKVVLIDPPFDRLEEDNSYLGVKSYRGGGYAISFKDVAIYGSPTGPHNEAQNLDLKIEVEWEGDYESFTKTYTIKIPLALCKVSEDLIEEAFDNWIKAIRKDNERTKREKDAKEFRALAKKYPALSAAECQRALDKILKDEDY
jgi:hypothetical protein